MTDHEYSVGVRLKGDGTGLVGETRAGVEAMRQLENQAKRTSDALGDTVRAQRGMSAEGTALKQVLDVEKEAMSALTRETGAMTSGTLAAQAAAAGLRGALSGVLSAIGGPWGIIAVLGSAALAWTSFGSAATKGAEEAEQAAQRSARAVAQISAFERMGALSDDLYAEAARIREDMTNRRQAMEARAAAAGPGRAHPSRGRLSVNVPVNPADAADEARLAEISQQLAALQETRNRWVAQESDQIDAKVDKAAELAQQRAARAEAARILRLSEDTWGRWRDIDNMIGKAVDTAADLGDQLQTRIYAPTHDILADWRSIDDLITRSMMSRSGFEAENLATVTRPELSTSPEEQRRKEEDLWRWRTEQAQRHNAQLEEMSSNLERSLTDATVRGLIEGFRRGEGAFENFLNRMEEAFLAAVFTPIIQPIMAPIAGMMAGVGQGIASSIWGNAAGGAAGASLGGLGGIGGYLGGMGTGLFADGAATAALIESGTVGAAGAGLEAAALGGWGAAAPWIAGGALALYALGAFDDAGPAERSSQYVAGFGQGGYAYQNNRWFSGDMWGAQSAFDERRIAAEQNLIRNLGLDGAQIAAVDSALGGISGRVYGFGMEGSDPNSSGAFERIMAARLEAISSALGRSIEELTRVMSMSAEQWQAAIDSLEKALGVAERNMESFARSLPERLGITGLEDFERSLATSSATAPLDRLAAARAYYDETLGLALGGDLSAVRAFTGAGQELLGIGRDLYASGAGYQDLVSEVRRSLADLIEQQKGEQNALEAELGVTVQEASQREIEAVREGFRELNQTLLDIRTELRRMQAT